MQVVEDKSQNSNKRRRSRNKKNGGAASPQKEEKTPDKTQMKNLATSSEKKKPNKNQQNVESNTPNPKQKPGKKNKEIEKSTEVTEPTPKESPQTPKSKRNKKMKNNAQAQLNVSNSESPKKENQKRKMSEEDAEDSQNKKPKANIMAQEKSNESSMCTAVRVFFPRQINNAKPFLEEIIKHSEDISNLRSLVVRFSSEEEAQQKVEKIKNIDPQLNVQLIEKPKGKEFNPLKKVIHISPSANLNNDEVKKFFGADSIGPLFPDPNHRLNKTLFVLTFSTEAEASEAANKEMKQGPVSLRLKPFFSYETISSPPEAQKRKIESTENVAKKPKVVVEENDDDDDDEEEEDDDDDEEEEDDDKADDDEEEEEDDDDDE